MGSAVLGIMSRVPPVDSGSPDAPARQCVLIVDDNEALRRALARCVRARGHEVLEVESGREAVALVATRRVDVILSDIRMPDMDGMSLLQVVHERNPRLPVLLMTGSPELESAVKAVEYGAFEYLMKPIDNERLLASIHRALSRADAESGRSEREDDESADLADSARRSWTGVLLGGRYRIGRLIGAGGMGNVYEALREDLGNMPVAIKVLHPGFSRRLSLMARFRREAEILASIHHPNIVKILDFQAEAGRPPFLVMELLHGATLASAIGQGVGLAEQRVTFIASQVLSALTAAHQAQVIHRDMKPENVFLVAIAGVEDVVKLLDFGIAKTVPPMDQQHLTQAGTLVGTPAYMAPEYAGTGLSDMRGDIYSVGCVMYEAFAGRPAFEADNYHALLFAIQHHDPEPLGALRSDLPPALAAIVAKAMAKDPDARFQSANEMAAALEPWTPRQIVVSQRPPIASPTTLAPTEVASEGPLPADLKKE